MLSITSFTFLAALLPALLLYYLIPKKPQWITLLLFSITFIFLYSGLSAFVFLAIDIAAVYIGTALLKKADNERRRKWITALSVAVVAGMLFMLKYLNNVAVWSDEVLATVGLRLPQWRCPWLAPVGISYFSLSAIGYILDVSWGSVPAERNPARLALLVMWFPALICGPITRYSELSESIFAYHTFDYTKVKFGAERTLYGLFKKLVISNRLSVITGIVFSDVYQFSGVYIVVAVILFALQIYADFSGCMDICLGVSEMFQVNLPENFQRPFFSQSLSEFWRRWHISLGQWAKDCVMYPLLKSNAFTKLGAFCKKKLGKKRGKAVPTYIGMLVLWLIIGIWHGGTIKHIFTCGILLWFFIVGGKILQPFFDALSAWLKIKKESFGFRLFCSLRTLALMCITWIFFNTPSLSDGFWGLKNILINRNVWVLFDGSISVLGTSPEDLQIVFFAFLVILAVSILQERGVKIRESIEKQDLIFQWLIWLILLFAILIYGVYGPGYNPPDFIYRG